jgi:hypothetical protein
VNSGNPPLVSSTLPPPNRVRSQDLAIAVPSYTTIPELISERAYQPDAKRHHVVLYIPPAPSKEDEIEFG